MDKSVAGLPIRQAVRGLMIDHSDRVLLVKLDLPKKSWEPGWILPGGGIEADEDAQTALRRELLEETGLADPFIGPIVMRRRMVSSNFGPDYAGQEEEVFLVPCHDFPLAPALSPEELRAEGVVDMQWFTLAELRATADNVFPPELPELIDQVLEFGGSIEPMFIEFIDQQS